MPYLRRECLNCSMEDKDVSRQLRDMKKQLESNRWKVDLLCRELDTLRKKNIR